MLNAAALVSGDGAELQSLLDSVFFGEIEGFSLAAVISTERGSFALTRAEGAHVPGYVVEEAIFPNGASFSLALLNKLHDLDIDFIILAGFAPKLSEGLARAYRGRAVGLSTLASAVGEDQSTLEDVYEPYLLQRGLIVRTPQGRQATPVAFEHLGMEPPA